MGELKSGLDKKKSWNALGLTGVSRLSLGTG